MTLDQSPTEIDPENLERIRVVQTIKEDLVVFDLVKAGALLDTQDAALACSPSIRAVRPEQQPDRLDGGMGPLSTCAHDLTDYRLVGHGHRRSLTRPKRSKAPPTTTASTPSGADEA